MLRYRLLHYRITNNFFFKYIHIDTKRRYVVYTQLESGAIDVVDLEPFGVVFRAIGKTENSHERRRKR